MSASSSTATLHEHILTEIEQRILRGRWPPGYRIPSEQQLSEHYGCSRMTVNKVLTQLARAGLVERRRKAGTFVMRSQSRSAVLEIQDIGAEVRSLGQAYRYEVLARKLRRSTRVDMAALDLQTAHQVMHLTTLHFAAQRPFCLEQRLINLEAVPGAAAQDFSDEAPGPWLVHHVPWTSAEHRIRATGADADTALALKLKPGAPCLQVERRTWLGPHTVTSVRLTYPGDGHDLVARFAPTSAP